MLFANPFSGIPKINSKPRVSSTPYTYDISEGHLADHSVVRVFGRNADVDNAIEDLWESGGSYVFPPAGGIQMEIVSSQAADAAAGTGARTVMLHYLDANYNEQEEIITMNGTTPVDTVATDILRINNLHILTAGTGNAAAGLITLRNTGATVSYSFISGRFTNSRQAIYTVPKGKKMFITSYSTGFGTATASIYMEFRLVSTSTHSGTLTPGIFQLKDTLVHMPGPTFEREFELPIEIPATADVKLSAIGNSATSNAVCSGMIEGWIEDI